MEEWRAVVGYEGVYEVSDAGRVRRIATGRVLRHNLTHGYPRLTLAAHGTTRSMCIHTLVAAAFIGPRPDGTEINHINVTKTDNRPENLEYLAKPDHEQHTARTGRKASGGRNGAYTRPERRPTGARHGSRTHPERLARGDRNGAHTRPERVLRGEHNGNAQLNEGKVREILRLLPTTTGAALARQFGVSGALISRIALGKAWTHISRKEAGIP